MFDLQNHPHLEALNLYPLRDIKIDHILDITPPTLKRLYLNYYGASSHSRKNADPLKVPLEKIRTNFPKLKTLFLVGCSWRDISLEINKFSSLETLGCSPRFVQTPRSAQDLPRLEIELPNLRELYLDINSIVKDNKISCPSLTSLEIASDSGYIYVTSLTPQQIHKL